MAAQAVNNPNSGLLIFDELGFGQAAMLALNELRNIFFEQVLDILGSQHILDD